MAAIQSGDAYVDTDLGTNDADHGTSEGAGACASLAYMLGTRVTTLTGPLTIHCKGSAADTTYAECYGHGTAATNKITIVVDAANRHSGVWSASHYRLVVSDSIALGLYDDYVSVVGLQVQSTNPTAVSRHPIAVNYQNASNKVEVSHALLRGHGSATHHQCGIRVIPSTAIVDIWNSIVYGVAGISDAAGIYAGNCTTVNVRSCTVIGGEIAIRRDAGTVTAKNCYAGGSSYADYYGTITKANCASEDTSAGSADGCVSSIACDTATGAGHAGFENVTAGSEDYRLKAGSALIDIGAATGEGAPLNFTTDITGATRSGTWDIGADEYVAAGGGFKAAWARGSARIIQ